MNPEIKDAMDRYYAFWFGINALYEKWAKKYSLTSNSLFTLYMIREYPGQCTQRFICEKLLSPKQTVNTILEAFDKKGYIKKVADKEDRRNKYIYLTQEGRMYADHILSELYRFEETALNQMGAEKREGMIETSHTFLECLMSALDNE